MDARHVVFKESGLADLDGLLRTYVETGKYAGMSGLVWQGGREVYFGAHGMQEIATRRPIARDTVFRIYSMTKPVASVALMMLWEEDAFDLDDPRRRLAADARRRQHRLRQRRVHVAPQNRRVPRRRVARPRRDEDLGRVVC